ncbi:uncharacterized protein CLAFUR5_03319 [Fulvia fulva]|uniref:Uncharacterized protein n=1 Tax=Passalora fulva TaxID=5499 RepID=A0A9Q8LAK8_PASFU|nr:uncharacterized protein CLAFUR5_03319 [Fulvia fulva]UJO13897.1 hypothetical protein CLAFUR5_03319 [Fulvia fulva]
MLLSNIALLLGSSLINVRGALLPTDLKVPQPSVCGLQELFCYHTGTPARNATRMEAAIDYACSAWDGHQFPKSEGKEGVSEYYSPRTNESTVSMVVRKTGRFNSLCGYKVLKETCTYWLSKPFECPSQQGGNVTDLWCGLEWTIDPDGRTLEDLSKGTVQKMNCSGSSVNGSAVVAHDATTPDRAVSGSSVTFYDGPPLERRQDIPDADSAAFSTTDFNEARCYDSGHTWTAEWMVKGADKFCTWANAEPVQGGGYLNYTHHVCANGKDYRQWFSFENPDPKVFTLSYAACRIYTQPFIDDCDHTDDAHKSVKQGGWGVRSAGMNGYVVVDGDPDVHNAGKAEAALGNCNDESWVKSLSNYYASDELSQEDMKFAATHGKQ